MNLSEAQKEAMGRITSHPRMAHAIWSVEAHPGFEPFVNLSGVLKAADLKELAELLEAVPWTPRGD